MHKGVLSKKYLRKEELSALSTGKIFSSLFFVHRYCILLGISQEQPTVQVILP